MSEPATPANLPLVAGFGWLFLVCGFIVVLYAYSGRPPSNDRELIELLVSNRRHIMEPSDYRLFMGAGWAAVATGALLLVGFLAVRHPAPE